MHLEVERKKGIGYNMNIVLTIAGSDCSGGAGIQADIKTIMAHGAYAMSVVTALTAQNTLGISGIMEVDAEFIRSQLEAVFSDLPPRAVKIGMICSEQAVSVISSVLRAYHATNIVIDTVMDSTSGTRFMDRGTLRRAKEELYPLATLLTPNIPEAEALSGIPVRDDASMVRAAQIISQHFGCAVLCKGGHQKASANDLLHGHGQCRWFKEKRISNPDTHGTGCTLSSAIACRLAEGMELADAVYHAKRYLTGILQDEFHLGRGSGPLNHGALLHMNV